jgi:hypothetical protein
MLRGQFAVIEGFNTAEFLSTDGAVRLAVTSLDPIPRVGETVDLGEGALFVVEHVRWVFQPGGTLSSGRSTARILLAPTQDTFAAR